MGALAYFAAFDAAPAAAEKPPVYRPGSPKLLDRVRSAMRTRHMSHGTEEAYVFWIRRYIVFHGRRHPETPGGEEVTRFLSHLAEQHRVSASTQNQALSALLFLYRRVLAVDLPRLVLAPPSRQGATRSVTPSPRTFSRRATTSARCRSCSVTATSVRR